MVHFQVSQIIGILEFEKKINPSNVAVKNYLENRPTLYSDLKDKSSKFKAGKVVSDFKKLGFNYQRQRGFRNC